MSAPKHSPAPWKFTAPDWDQPGLGEARMEVQPDFDPGWDAHSHHASIVDANGDGVVGHTEYNVFGGENQVANVRLLLAAPEMRRLLRAICDSASEAEEYRAIMDAEALLAKIDGETT